MRFYDKLISALCIIFSKSPDRYWKRPHVDLRLSEDCSARGPGHGWTGHVEVQRVGQVVWHVPGRGLGDAEAVVQVEPAAKGRKSRESKRPTN